ncbi:MAG: hypothetical protein K2M46_10480 [Lachnospiraceae bacterium]|nr:hypothetical protein [Lachnospiraceae bacterium]
MTGFRRKLMKSSKEIRNSHDITNFDYNNAANWADGFQWGTNGALAAHTTRSAFKIAVPCKPQTSYKRIFVNTDESEKPINGYVMWREIDSTGKVLKTNSWTDAFTSTATTTHVLIFVDSNAAVSEWVKKYGMPFTFMEV